MGPQSRPAEFNSPTGGTSGCSDPWDRPRWWPLPGGALSVGRAPRPVSRQSEAPVYGSPVLAWGSIDSGGIGLLGDRGTPAAPALRLGRPGQRARSTGEDCSAVLADCGFSRHGVRSRVELRVSGESVGTLSDPS